MGSSHFRSRPFIKKPDGEIKEFGSCGGKGWKNGRPKPERAIKWSWVTNNQTIILASSASFHSNPRERRPLKKTPVHFFIRWSFFRRPGVVDTWALPRGTLFFMLHFLPSKKRRKKGERSGTVQPKRSRKPTTKKSPLTSHTHHNPIQWQGQKRDTSYIQRPFGKGWT